MVMRSRSRGYVALTTVLLVGVVGTSISVSLLLLGIMHTKTAMTVAYGNNAYSYSEACIEDGLRRINQNVAYTTGADNTLTFVSGGCSYAVTGTAPNKVINSTGTSGQSTRRIKVIINQTSPTIGISSWQEVVSF